MHMCNWSIREVGRRAGALGLSHKTTTSGASLLTVLVSRDDAAGTIIGSACFDLACVGYASLLVYFVLNNSACEKDNNCG